MVPTEKQSKIAVMLEKIRAFFAKIKLPKWLQRIRASLPQQVKMTILMVVGFTMVFSLIGTFTISQFRVVMYGNAQDRVEKAFDPQSGFDRPLQTAQVTDYVQTFQDALALKEGKVYLKS